MKLLPAMLAVIVLCLLPKPLPAEDAPAKANPEKLRLDNYFFAFDNSNGFRRVLPPTEQATMLKELGYPGVGYTGGKGIPAMLKAFDADGLRIDSIYVMSTIGPDGPSYDQDIKTAVEQLKGRDTVIWLCVRGKVADAKDAQAQAVKVVGEVGKLAAGSGLRVALYPHTGYYVDTTEQAVRVVKEVGLKNVGVSLNLCHRLKIDGEKDMGKAIEAAMPHLFMVSIHGTDGGDTKAMGWDRLIQRLDRGDYDVYGFLKMLKQLGYQGPIGLQCYKVPGDAKDNLAGSMAAWKKLVARMAAEHK
jgi:sugar phosphate isomerase/epimerase